MNNIVPMSQQAVVINGDRSLTAADLRTQVNLIQDVMRSIMRPDVHYGVIPGTKKPSLYKPGAEVLCVTFRIADKYDIEDLSKDGIAHYRVRCLAIHQTSTMVLGEGMGECSSHEEKYKWRRAICKEEFDATPENLRRIKFSKYQGKVEKQEQIRTEPADQANTILKMACKRAKIAMVLNVTAASDIFTQDIEDLPEELRDQVAEDARTRSRTAAAAAQQATPPDSPERDAAIASCRAAAAKGTDHFRAWWKDTFPKESRALVADKVADFQKIAASADSMTNDSQENV